MYNFVVWTKTKWEFEADPRDLVAEAVLQTPTAVDIKNLPTEYHNEALIGATYYQNGWGSCVALWTTHSMLMQNTRELIKKNPWLVQQIANKIKSGVNAIELYWEDLWTKMGHNLADKKDSGDYVEKGLSVTNKLGIKGKTYDGKDTVFFGLNYSHSRDYSQNMLKYWITKYPLVIAISWTSKTWWEMMTGEVKTIIEKVKCTGAHCIDISWYDSYGIILPNSWSPNDKTGKKCMFRISWANIQKMVDVGMLNWRYWIEFDKEDAVLDLDMYIEENNAIEILRAINKFWGKTHYPDTQKACETLGATIRKNYTRANKEVPLK